MCSALHAELAGDSASGVARCCMLRLSEIAIVPECGSKADLHRPSLAWVQ